MLDLKMIMNEVYEAFPELEEKSLDTICTDGLKGILSIIRSNEDMIIVSSNREEFRLYIPESPQEQWRRLDQNKLRRKRAQLNKENGSKQKNT